MIEYDMLYGDGAGNYLGISILAITPINTVHLASFANLAARAGGGSECN
jgi:hypothetical protein